MREVDRYSINIVWSEEDRAFVATSPVFSGLMAFGDTKEEALREAGIALEEFIKALQDGGDQLPEPDVAETYSGQFRARLPKSLHRKVAEAAAKDGVSLNQYIVAKLSAAEIEERTEKRITNIYANSYSIQITQSSADGQRLPSPRPGMAEIICDNE